MEEMVQAMKNVKYVPNTERMDRRRGWKYLRQMAKNSKKLKVGKVDETITAMLNVVVLFQGL